MASTALTRNPCGIFDRRTLGTRTPAVTFHVERGRVAFFAETIAETDPIHLDADAARTAGHPDIVAPATFATVIDLEAGRALERQGVQGALALIGCDFRRLLHGGERYDYEGMIFGGDDVSVETEVLAFEDKKGGALELAHLETRISNSKRGRLVTITRTLVHRLEGGE